MKTCDKCEAPAFGRFEAWDKSGTTDGPKETVDLCPVHEEKLSLPFHLKQVEEYWVEGLF